ncbi:hypothetical protein GQL56_00315 [Pseudomonas putida]|nr:hypothetical protein [Pseudomonas putida]
MATSQTTNASLSQIAALLGIAPNNLHPADLPPAVPIRTGKAGRPQHVVPLDELAEFALAMTPDLTDAECRLKCAVAAQRRQRRHAGVIEILPVYDEPRIEEPRP